MSRPELRRQRAEPVPEAATPRMNEQIDAYAHRDGEARYRQALGWLLDGAQRTDR